MNKQLEFQCDCGCCEGVEEIKEKESSNYFQKYCFDLIKLLIACALLVICSIFNLPNVINIITLLCAVLACGCNLIVGCVKSIIKKNFFSEHLLMLIATIVAFVIGEYFESVLIVILYSIGELLEKTAVDNSRKKISDIAEIKIKKVNVFTKQGVIETEPENVAVGSIIEVKKGEKIPFDSKLISMEGVFDLKSVTGESKPCELNCGDKVLSGAINIGNPVIIKTEKTYAESTLGKVSDMVEKSLGKKSESQKFISKFAKFYTPIITVIALVVAIIVPLFDGLNFIKWIYKALSFLVISCPCALVISVPLAFFSAIGGLAKKGILVKGSNYLDSLAKCKHAVFDKTGTITHGKLKVDKIYCFGSYDEKTVVEYANALEQKSVHPIAKAITEFAKQNGYDDLTNIEDVKEESGLGIVAKIGDKKIRVGSSRYIKSCGIKAKEINQDKSTIFVCKGKKVIGIISFTDEIKTNTIDVFSELKNEGIKQITVLSGDCKSAVEEICKQVGVSEYQWGLLPEDKVNKLIEIKNSKNGGVLFVGDGVNDAPIIAESDVGFAMGGIGSEVSVETADVVVLDDDISKVAMAFRLSKKVRRTVITNIVFSLAIKFTIMLLSVFITLPIYAAMIADVGVMLLAVMNSLSCYYISTKKRAK